MVTLLAFTDNTIVTLLGFTDNTIVTLLAFTDNTISTTGHSISRNFSIDEKLEKNA